MESLRHKAHYGRQGIALGLTVITQIVRISTGDNKFRLLLKFSEKYGSLRGVCHRTSEGVRQVACVRRLSTPRLV